MLGIGTLVNSLLYDARLALGPGEGNAFLRAIAPDYHEYRRVQIMIILSHKLKYVYVVNPKVASTSVRNRLHELNGFPPLDDPRDVMGHRNSGFDLPKTMSAKALKDVLVSPDYYKFSFVRNPFDRIVSAYTYFQRGIEKNPPEEKRRLYVRAKDPRRDPKTRTRMTFAEFVEGVCNGGPVQDQHWRTQSDILKLDIIPYDFVGKFESFSDDLAFVLKRLGADDEIVARARQVTNASKRKPDVGAYYTDRLAGMVREAFADDFSNFDYSRDVPLPQPSTADATQ